MKAGKTSSIICIIMLFICIVNMHALGETAFTPKENIKIENSIINDQYNELNVYDVTYKDFQKVYTSAMFNSSEVVSTKSESADDIEAESHTYKYKDGFELCIADSMSLFYYNANGDYYSQILTYLNSSENYTNSPELTGFSLNEATKVANDFIASLEIKNLVLDKAFTFSKESLVTITNDMKKIYGENGAKFFSSITDETEAYYLTYRQTLDGIKTAGTPQIQMVITRNGIAYLEMFRIIDQVNNKTTVTEQSSWKDAICFFEERNINAHNLPESISVLYEIEEISISYYRDPDPEQKLCASLFPCWYIKGYETMTNGDKARTKQIADIYRIPDGVWYYPN